MKCNKLMALKEIVLEVAQLVSLDDERQYGRIQLLYENIVACMSGPCECAVCSYKEPSALVDNVTEQVFSVQHELQKLCLKVGQNKFFTACMLSVLKMMIDSGMPREKLLEYYDHMESIVKERNNELV